MPKKDDKVNKLIDDFIKDIEDGKNSEKLIKDHFNQLKKIADNKNE